MSKILVAYFSATGTTARLAHELANVSGADLFAIEPQTPYTIQDLNWHDRKSRSTLEMEDPASRPAIGGKVENMASYDLVLIGFPIWWHQAPRIIETFLQQYDFSGKKLAPFATSGGSPMGNTESILEKICPNAIWLPGRRLDAMTPSQVLREWVEELSR